MRKKIAIFFCGAILQFVWCLSAVGQTQPTMSQIKDVLDALKKLDEVSYNYSMAIQYPNGQKTKLIGRVYASEQKKMLYNDNNAFLMLYSNQWYYKADHKKRTVSIVNLDKEYSNSYKSAVEKDIFQHGALAQFLDSIVVRFGTVERYKKSGDTIKVAITFPIQLIEKIEITYDTKHKALVDYNIKIFRAFDDEPESKSGLSQTITCNNFVRKVSNKKFSTDKLFTLSRDKIELRRYSKYKLYSKL